MDLKWLRKFEGDKDRLNNIKIMAINKKRQPLD
jgi:hypothetical protein